MTSASSSMAATKSRSLAASSRSRSRFVSRTMLDMCRVPDPTYLLVESFSLPAFRRHVLAYLNGHFLPRSAAAVPVDDRGFVFGDGVYEVWRAVGGSLFESERHVERLQRGLDELRIARPDVATAPRLRDIARRLLTDADL